jgi:hypothetical protein
MGKFIRGVSGVCWSGYAVESMNTVDGGYEVNLEPSIR